MNFHAWRLLARNQFLGFVREPAAAGFNLAVPLFIVVMQAVAFGRVEIGDDLPGYDVVDLLPVAAGTMFVMIIGIFGMGIGLASLIEARSLGAYRLRPGGLGALLSAYASVLVSLIVAGLAIATAVLAVGWGIHDPARPLVIVPALFIGSVFFLSIGSLAAALGGSPRSAQAVSSALFFPLLFLSGAMFPIGDFPAALRVIAVCLPGYHLYELFVYAWVHSQPFPVASVVYLVIGAAFGAATALRILNRREDL